MKKICENLLAELKQKIKNGELILPIEFETNQFFEESFLCAICRDVIK
jgi:hypothetical protein